MGDPMQLGIEAALRTAAILGVARLPNAVEREIEATVRAGLPEQFRVVAHWDKTKTVTRRGDLVTVHQDGAPFRPLPFSKCSANKLLVALAVGRALVCARRFHF
jgi:hypothetical protein